MGMAMDQNALTFQELLKAGEQQLSDAGIPEAKVDAWYLMEAAFGIDRTWYYLHGGEAAADEAKVSQFLKWINKRAEGIPVQQLTGKASFMGFEFEVTGDVLVPRQDTETLVETALSKLPEDACVLDMCTGSGCIILSLAALRPDIRGLGADLSEKALAVAEKNCIRLGLSGRIELKHSDMFETISGRFDMIVSNPPYIRSDEIENLMREVKDHEPRMALDGGADGLVFYRRLVADAPEHLKAGGHLIMEIGFDQAADVTALMSAAGYKEITVVKDLPGLDRVVCGRI